MTARCWKPGGKFGADSGVATVTPDAKGQGSFSFPADTGQAYLFGEFSTMNVARMALMDRGLSAEQISFKAFWRAGQANQDQGEPARD